MNTLENIDINQQHIYRHTDKIPGLINERVEKYEKPFAIGEFGYEWDWSKNFNDFAVEMDADFKKGLWYGLFNPTPILPMSWWWEFFENRGMMAYFKNVRIINDDMLSSGKGDFHQVNVESDQDDLKIHSVQCGQKIYTYVLGDDNTSPELTFPGINSQIGELQYFNCETGEYHKVEGTDMSANSLSLRNMPLKTGIVLVMSVKQE
jgi:hypothetical protein